MRRGTCTTRAAERIGGDVQLPAQPREHVVHQRQRAITPSRCSPTRTSPPAVRVRPGQHRNWIHPAGRHAGPSQTYNLVLPTATAQPSRSATPAATPITGGKIAFGDSSSARCPACPEAGPRPQQQRRRPGRQRQRHHLRPQRRHPEQHRDRPQQRPRHPLHRARDERGPVGDGHRPRLDPGAGDVAGCAGERVRLGRQNASERDVQLPAQQPGNTVSTNGIGRLLRPAARRPELHRQRVRVSSRATPQLDFTACRPARWTQPDLQPGHAHRQADRLRPGRQRQPHHRRQGRFGNSSSARCPACPEAGPRPQTTAAPLDANGNVTISVPNGVTLQQHRDRPQQRPRHPLHGAGHERGPVGDGHRPRIRSRCRGR